MRRGEVEEGEGREEEEEAAERQEAAGALTGNFPLRSGLQHSDFTASLHHLKCT